MYNKVIAVIPAREGSVRVKNKNIRTLDSIPLITHSILTAMKSSEIDDVYVSTDSDEIKAIARSLDCNIINRPKELATNNSTDLEWFIHFLDEYKKKYNNYPELIIHLRPTTPLRDLKVVDSAIVKFDKYFDSLRSIEEMSEVPEKMFRYKLRAVNPNSIVNAITYQQESYQNNPNQSFLPAYKPNGYIDIINVEAFFRNKCETLHGEKVQGFITEKVVEIDTEEDFNYLEYILRNKNGK